VPFARWKHLAIHCKLESVVEAVWLREWRREIERFPVQGCEWSHFFLRASTDGSLEDPGKISSCTEVPCQGEGGDPKGQGVFTKSPNY